MRRTVDLYPAEDGGMRSEIDTLNEQIYQAINNGAYKAGFFFRSVGLCGSF